MATLTKHELNKARYNLNYAFDQHIKYKYDGRVLLEAWDRLVKASRAVGLKPVTKPHQRPEYWNDPETYSNEQNNKNRIVEITDDFKIIHVRDLHKIAPGTLKKDKKPASRCDISKAQGALRCDISKAQGALRCDIINTKNPEEMSPRTAVIDRPQHPYYYKVNISWVERSDTPKDVIQKVLHYLEVTGLEPIKVYDFDNGHEIEKTAEFKMQGDEGAFRWVKRGIMGALDLLVGGIPEFNIAISGKKYEDFEIDKNTQ